MKGASRCPTRLPSGGSTGLGAPEEIHDQHDDQNDQECSDTDVHELPFRLVDVLRDSAPSSGCVAGAGTTTRADVSTRCGERRARRKDHRRFLRRVVTGRSFVKPSLQCGGRPEQANGAAHQQYDEQPSPRNVDDRAGETHTTVLPNLHARKRLNVNADPSATPPSFSAAT